MDKELADALSKLRDSIQETNNSSWWKVIVSTYGVVALIIIITLIKTTLVVQNLQENYFSAMQVESVINGELQKVDINFRDISRELSRRGDPITLLPINGIRLKEGKWALTNPQLKFGDSIYNNNNKNIIYGVKSIGDSITGSMGNNLNIPDASQESDHNPGYLSTFYYPLTRGNRGYCQEIVQ